MAMDSNGVEGSVGASPVAAAAPLLVEMEVESMAVSLDVKLAAEHSSSSISAAVATENTTTTVTTAEEETTTTTTTTTTATTTTEVKTVKEEGAAATMSVAVETTVEEEVEQTTEEVKTEVAIAVEAAAEVATNAVSTTVEEQVTTVSAAVEEQTTLKVEAASVVVEEVKTEAVASTTTTGETTVEKEETKLTVEAASVDAEDVKTETVASLTTTAEAAVEKEETKLTVEAASVVAEEEEMELLATTPTAVELLEEETATAVETTSVAVEEKLVELEAEEAAVKQAADVHAEAKTELVIATEAETAGEDKTSITTAVGEHDEHAADETADLSEMEPSVAVATTPPKKKWLGGFMPKVPSLLKKTPSTVAGQEPKDKDHHSTTSSRDSEHSDENGGEPSDELRSLTEQPATEKEKEKEKVPLASRLRGLSIEQSAFFRKINGFRTQSSSESPRNSIDGMPPQPRRSLIGGFTGSNSNGVPSPRSDPTLKARRGTCVATKFGTGTVLDIRLDDGFFIVQLVPKSIAYLREDAIIREIKSVVGERVKTRWGLATVEQYYADEDMYNIALDWRWDDDHVWRMKATTKKFDKISRSMSIVQNTKNRLFEGYSTIRESASFGYANVAAKINTTASTYKPASRTSQTQSQLLSHGPLPSHAENLGKALTPYGLCTVIEVRPDQFFVVKTKCGAIGYLHADSVKLLHRRTNFALGERVKTPYGVGEVVMYRDEDEVYEVKLDIAVPSDSTPPMLYISDAQAETMMMPAGANGGPNYARLSSIFNMTRNSVYSASATVKASATGGLTTLSNVKSKVSTMAAIKMTKAKFQKGERVITAFGSGFVSDSRPLEKIYEVQLRRLKFKGYFHESSLQSFPYERVTHFIVDGKTIPAPAIPKNLPEHKRRDIITTAMRQARNGR